MIAAHAHGAGAAAGMAADAAFHLAFPEAHAFFQREFVKEAQRAGTAVGGGHGLRHSGADEHVGQHRIGVGALTAFVLRGVLHGHRVFLAARRHPDGVAGTLHILNGRALGQFFQHTVQIHGAVAAHAEDGHVILVDELLGQQLDHALAVTALDHHADPAALVLGQEVGEVVDVEGSPDQMIHFFRGLHEHRFHMQRVETGLPAEFQKFMIPSVSIS